MFSVDKKQGNCRFSFHYQEKEYDFAGKIKICPNPVCTCNKVDILFKEDGDFINEPLAFEFNIEDSTLNKGKELKENEKIFFENFSRELNESGSEIISKIYLEHKLFFSENSKLEEIEASFPRADIEESALIAYHEILPYGMWLSVRLNNTDFLLMDYYCINLRCDCRKTLIHILINDADAKNDDTARVWYNYKKNSWSVEDEGSPDYPHVNDLIDQIKSKYPNISRTIDSRHDKLKRLYQLYLERENISSDANASVEIRRKKIGRNEPCPCGSGKKFKKCCIEKGIYDPLPWP